LQRRFQKVGARSGPIDWEFLVSFLQLARHNWQQGPQARRLFWRTLWSALRHSPGRLIQVGMQLGMYEHFAQVHADAWSWSPWQKGREEEALLPSDVTTH
jgi:hypothetical protein